MIKCISSFDLRRLQQSAAVPIGNILKKIFNKYYKLDKIDFNLNFFYFYYCVTIKKII